MRRTTLVHLIAAAALAVLPVLPAVAQTTSAAGNPEVRLAGKRIEAGPVLRIKALTLALRVAMGQLDEPAAARDIVAITGRLAAAEKPGAWSDVFASEHRDAAAAFFDHVAQVIARPQRWPADQSARFYRLLARDTLSDGRSMHAAMVAKGRYPGMGIDEAYYALAWSRGRKPAADDPAMPTRLAGRLLDRALPEVSAAAPGAGPPKVAPPTKK